MRASNRCDTKERSVNRNNRNKSTTNVRRSVKGVNIHLTNIEKNTDKKKKQKRWNEVEECIKKLKEDKDRETRKRKKDTTNKRRSKSIKNINDK